MLVRGIGEKLTAASPLCSCCIVIAKQGEKSSTGSLYSQYDLCGAKKRPDLTAMLDALEAESLKAVGENLCNVFEELAPQSNILKSQMLGYGALGASLSGSGPSVFGIFSSKTEADGCAGLIGGNVYVCAPEKYGCEIVK